MDGERVLIFCAFSFGDLHSREESLRVDSKRSHRRNCYGISKKKGSAWIRTKVTGLIIKFLIPIDLDVLF